MSINSIFKKLDEFLFRKIDNLKNNRNYQMIVSKLSELPTSQQRMAAQVFTFTVLLIPLIIFVFIFYGNYKIKKEIEMRQSIMYLIEKYSEDKRELSNIASSVASPIPLTNNAEATQLLKEISDRRHIDPKKMSLSNFEVSSSLKGLSMSQLDINFKDFSINDLTNLITVLLAEKKSKISKIDITKDGDKNNLSGLLHIVHYSRNLGGSSNEEI